MPDVAADILKAFDNMTPEQTEVLKGAVTKYTKARIAEGETVRAVVDAILDEAAPMASQHADQVEIVCHCEGCKYKNCQARRAKA